MPEGPEIKRLSDAIRRVVGDEVVTGVEIAKPILKRYEAQLKGARVVGVVPRGKATVFEFSNDLCVYTHLQLYGRWFFAKGDEVPDVNRQLKFSLQTERGGVFLYSSPDVEVHHREDLATHSYLSKLGPDVLDDSTTSAQLVKLLKEPSWSKQALGKLLLEQSLTAGVGNYLRSEILFVSGLRPERKPAELSSGQLDELARHWLEIPRRSYTHQGVTTPDEHVAQRKALGEERDEYRFYVYKRAGKPCLVCGTSIEEEEYGSRRIFVCPRCQS